MKFRAIGFDYGGVLVGGSGFLKGVADIIEMPVHDLKVIYFKHNTLVNIHGVPWSEFWNIVITEVGKADRLPQVLDYLEKLHSPSPDARMIALIDQLRSLGYKVGLLSNNNRENANQMRTEGLDTHFDAFLISEEIGFQKPNPEAFKVLTDGLGVASSELIFIDDSEQSLKFANQIGFHPILFTGYENLMESLELLKIVRN